MDRAKEAVNMGLPIYYLVFTISDKKGLLQVLIAAGPWRFFANIQGVFIIEILAKNTIKDDHPNEEP